MSVFSIDQDIFLRMFPQTRAHRFISYKKEGAWVTRVVSTPDPLGTVLTPSHAIATQWSTVMRYYDGMPNLPWPLEKDIPWPVAMMEVTAILRPFKYRMTALNDAFVRMMSGLTPSSTWMEHHMDGWVLKASPGGDEDDGTRKIGPEYRQGTQLGVIGGISTVSSSPHPMVHTHIWGFPRVWWVVHLEDNERFEELIDGVDPNLSSLSTSEDAHRLRPSERVYTRPHAYYTYVDMGPNLITFSEMAQDKEKEKGDVGAWAG
ncbi:hypothetical protein I316_05935 [Kwoniella heveanensis BCC8398]|uniref:Uncharacterized protein n=1 Tax=Kwoniella heveanensis BCC8398 TaxID=1296120 RepID=A0A1B9GNC7_9TREE|nr:hypothetical protein I316_05935 [Kwoniella heveanensis BCC8398]